jgi:chorismate lyase
MGAMFADNQWAITPPEIRSETDRCLSGQGSLTERLIATGRAFAVTVLYQGLSEVRQDEHELIGEAAGAGVLARHVALSLDGVPVVVARSIARRHCPIWQPVLQRGSRSLGLTLFGADSPIVRAPMHYLDLDAGHPLFPLARGLDPTGGTHYRARRSNFILDGAALNVCEIFLPALETLL